MMTRCVMNAIDDWTMQRVEVVSTKTISITTDQTLAPLRKSCPMCKFDGTRAKGGIKWERFFYAYRVGGRIALNCRKCDKRLKSPLD